jgi:cysteine desulfurase/selenocysteine lyase
MTTNNLQGAESLEQLAGVPTAAELESFANSLFPDLTEGISQAGSAAGITPEPEVCAKGIDDLLKNGDTAVFDLAAKKAKQAWKNFDWEHPFAPAQGYTPVVVSQAQAGNDSIVIGSKTLAQIRSDFPILSETINGNPLVWLDNGATTQRPRAVIDRLSYYYEHENSNVHRGAHTLAARSTDAYENARGIVSRFIGAPSADDIIFVRGTTEAINLVANAYVKPMLEPGDEIIVSLLEHHANIVPWQLIAEETGAVIKVIPVDKDGQLLLHEYEKLFTKKTKFVSVTHVSNTLGTITPVEELVAIAHRHGVRILIDGAQSVAHIPVNVSALDTDFFVFSGHKIYGPTGIGVVYGKKELLEAARPYHGGGNMIADVTFERTIYNPAPNKFEAGTGSIADAVGLGAALEYLEGIGMPDVSRWEHELLQYGLRELRTVKGLTLVGTARDKASALAFKLDGYSDDEVGARLDSYGVAVRVGHHCAQPVLRHFGYESVVRPTLALYNSPEDIDTMVRVLKSFA